jgi:conjugative relaxase-like TrwC/TraI family protein
MSKIAKLSGNSASKYYYEKDPLMNAEGNGENLKWYGKGAESLGLNLNDKVNKEDFESILDGKFKDVDLRYLDKKTDGEDRKAYDLVFSASKSISHMALVMGDERVLKAFNDSNNSTLDFVETLAQKREYSEGTRVKKDTGNLIVAQAQHSIARPVNGMVDPSLHTHNVIMNTTMGEDGKFTSLSSDKIYQNQSLIQEVFKSELAKNLKEQGFGITVNSKGDVEIAGYDKALRDQFSKRHFEIAKIKNELRNDPKYENISEKRLDFIAQHNFKEEKIDISKEDLKESWDKQTEMIISKDQLLKNVDEEAKYSQSQEKITAKEGVLLAINFEMEKEAVVSETKITKIALKIGRGDYTYNDVKKEIDSIVKDKSNIKNREETQGVYLGTKYNEKTKQDDRLFTNSSIYNKERESLEIMGSTKKFEPIMSLEDAEKYLSKYEEKKGFELSKGQREAYKEVLTSTDQFIAIQGKPGVGKTTLLSALNEAVVEHKGKEYADNLFKVLAPTGKAASGAQEESGISGSTVDSYLIQANKEKNTISSTSDKEDKTEQKDNEVKFSEIKKDEIVGEKLNKQDEELSSKINEIKSSEKNVSKDNEVKTSEIKKGNTENKNETTSKEESFKISALDSRKSDLKDFSEKYVSGISTKAHSEGLKEFSKSNVKTSYNVGLKGQFNFTKKEDGSTKNIITNKYTKEGNRSTIIEEKGSIRLKDTGKVIGFDKKTEIIQKPNGSKTNINVKFGDGTKQITKTESSNLFGNQSSKNQTNLIGMKKKDSEGNFLYKNTLSKNVSDMLYKKEEMTHQKIAVNGVDQRAFTKEETSLLKGLAYSSKTEVSGTKVGDKTLQESKTSGSFLGGMVKFQNEKMDYKKNGVLQETSSKTDLYVFGKKVENNFIKGMLNSSTLEGTYKTGADKLESLVNKVKEVSSSVSSSFNKEDKLEYKSVSKEVKGSVKDDLKVVEMSKIDDKKTAVSVSSYTKEPSSDKYNLERSETKIVNQEIEKVSKSSEKIEPVKEKEINKDNKVLFVDETSMMGTQKGNELLKHMKENDLRGVFVGDKNQLKSVSAGEVFERLLDKVKTVEVNEMNRQRKADEQTKEVVEKMTDKNVKGAFETLDKQGKFKETSKEEAFKEMKEAVLKDQDKTFVVMTKRDDVKGFNDLVRSEKYSKEQLEKSPKFETHQNKNLDGMDKMNSKSFEKGDLIGLRIKTESGKERFQDYKVKDVNHDRNQLLIGNDKQTFTINLSKEFSNITNVYKVEQKNFLEGDKIVMLKNNKKEDVMNGQFGTIKSVDEKSGKLVIDFEGKTKEIDLKVSDNKKIDFAYATTAHKSQGMSETNVYAWVDSKDSLATFNSLNVMGSRHKETYTLYTDNKSDLIKRAEKEQVKETTLSKEDLKNKGSEIKTETKSEKVEKVEKYEDFKPSDLDKFKSSDKDVSNENSLNKEDKSSNKHSEKDVSKENKVSSSNKKDEIVGEKFSGPDEELTSSKENRKENEVDFNKSSELSSKR